jgi:hypothetical protein
MHLVSWFIWMKIRKVPFKHFSLWCTRTDKPVQGTRSVTKQRCMQRGTPRNISAYVFPLSTKVEVRKCSCFAAIAPVLFCPQLKKNCRSFPCETRNWLWIFVCGLFQYASAWWTNWTVRVNQMFRTIPRLSVPRSSQLMRTVPNVTCSIHQNTINTEHNTIYNKQNPINTSP